MGETIGTTIGLSGGDGDGSAELKWKAIYGAKTHQIEISEGNGTTFRAETSTTRSLNNVISGFLVVVVNNRSTILLPFLFYLTMRNCHQPFRHEL